MDASLCVCPLLHNDHIVVLPLHQGYITIIRAAVSVVLFTAENGLSV